MNDGDLMALLKQQLRNSVMWEGDEHAKDMQSALDYYLQRARGDEVTGRSTVVAGDVSASVEANLAQMVDAFSSDHIAEFDALGAEDEDQAALESDTVTHFVMKVQNGFVELVSAIKNAELLRNGFVKIWCDRFEETTTRTFDNVAPEVLTMLDESAEVVSYDSEERSARLRITRTLKRFRARCVDNANFHYPKTWDSFDLQECPAVFERHVDTRSELVRMGFKKSEVSRLTPTAVDGHNAATTSRNVRGHIPSNTNTPDPSQDLIEWFEGYVLTDVDGDGIAERRRVCFSWDDEMILENEPAGLVPYACGAVLIMANRLTGISQYDKLRQTQDEHTGLKRALYDNVNSVTKNRLAYLDEKANVDDVGDGRPNGAIRVTGVDDVRQALMPFQVADNSAGLLANIEALKRERSELGGAALDLATGQLQIGGDRMGSQGLDRAYSVMEQLCALMTKTIAQTLIRNVWLLAHATLREHITEPVSIKRNGRWSTPIPSQWIARDRVTVRVGMSPGERARMANALRELLNMQVILADKGMDEVLVNVEGFYRAIMQWARVSDIRNPEQYLVDPMSPSAQKAFAAKANAATADAKQRKSLMDRAIGTEESRVALDKYKHDSELQFDYWNAVLESEKTEAEIVGSVTGDILKARESAKVTPIRSGAPNKKEASK